MRARLKHFIVSFFCKIFQLDFPNRWSVLIAGQLSGMWHSADINGKKLKFISNSELLFYRSKTILDKEPETNQWIEQIPPDAVFYDVGANVGIFSIMAAMFCRKVYAFEPVAVNYSILNQNLLLNTLDHKVTAYCLAISDKSHFDTMRLSSGGIGTAHHTFGANRDANHQTFTPVFKQGALAVSLDDLIEVHNFECPQYLKIDVDGNEHLVIGGAQNLLKNPQLRSILIELNKDLSIDQNLIEAIKSNGFELVKMGEDSVFKGMKLGNLIFLRKK